MKFRVEHDPLGDVRVPADAYYGAQTRRAVENFPISGLSVPSELVVATVQIKKADGRVVTIQARHSMTREQIAWFRAGSALNAGEVIDPTTGAPAKMEDVRLEPGDTKAKPGRKDV